MTVEDIIKETVHIIRKYLSCEYKVVLFGSQAKGTDLNTSDIDIGIIGALKIPHPIMTRMRDEIDNIRTLRSIDLVDLLTVDKHYRDNVLLYGKEIES